MGMDVIGADPKNKKGEYFRANGWAWHPIWDYCETIAPKICRKVKYAHSNDGDGLGSEDAEKLGNLILIAVKSGQVKKYISERNEEIKSLPHNPCPHCRGTGIRHWFIKKGTTLYKSSDYRPKYDWSILQHIIDGDGKLPKYKTNRKRPNEKEVTETCNACNGKGFEPPAEASYNFTVPHIKKFGEFLINCGGFSIY
ncbi:MAG: hypothetical protein EBT80_00580 [Chitinophagales bacterium]|nr:hypothetical protein [Chitinophagales bacterium]